jgi:hypothetical protein
VGLRVDFTVCDAEERSVVLLGVGFLRKRELMVVGGK